MLVFLLYAYVSINICCGKFIENRYPEGFATLRESAMQRRQVSRSWASPVNTAPREKLMWHEKLPVGSISVVTLIRTDTTLDHSQKAEKVWKVSNALPSYSAHHKSHKHFPYVLSIATHDRKYYWLIAIDVIRLVNQWNSFQSFISKLFQGK